MVERDPIGDLASTLEARKKTYSRAIARIALTPSVGTYRLCFGRIDLFHRRDNHEVSEVDLDYGDFRLIRTALAVDRVSELFFTLMRDPTHPAFVAIKDDVEVQTMLRLTGLVPRYVASYQRFSQVEPEWPSAVYPFWFADLQVQTPQIPLARKGLPLYPDGNEAIAQFCSLRMAFGESPANGLLFVFPDFRGRLKTLNIASGKLSVDVEALEENSQDLQVKFYYESNAARGSSSDLPFNNGHAEFEYDGDLEVALVHLLSAKSGDDIDNRVFNRLGIERRGGVTIAPSELWVKQLINGGEGLHVEFKQTEKQHGEFEGVVESVIAFANASGGTILIGVSDTGRIKGIAEDPRRYIESLENSMGHKCNPRPDVRYNAIEVDGRKILVLTVPQGRARPYHHIERGFFIRRDGTNLQAQRSEVKELFQIPGN